MNDLLGYNEKLVSFYSTKNTNATTIIIIFYTLNSDAYHLLYYNLLTYRDGKFSKVGFYEDYRTA